MREAYQFRFRRQTHGSCCPYCGRPVGYIGNFLAKLFGLRFHGCDWSNVKGPHEP